MKLVVTDEELQFMKDRYEKGDVHFFNTEQEFSINFKVTDVARAQYIFANLLNDHLPDVDLGISVTSLNFKPFVGNEALKARLHAMIDEVVV